MPDISRKGRGLALLREAQSRAEKEIKSEKDESAGMNSPEELIKSEQVSVIRVPDTESEVNADVKPRVSVRKRGRPRKVAEVSSQVFRISVSSALKHNLDLLRFAGGEYMENVSSSADVIDSLIRFYCDRSSLPSDYKKMLK